MLPPRDKITIGFAHVAYNCKARLDARNLGFRTLEARTRAELDAMLPELDVLSLSGMWRNDIPPLAPKLRYVQSMSAGTDQYDRAIMKAAGISLASAAGANAKAVSEHAIALMLAMTRRLTEARDNQHKKFWRGMQSDFWTREDELAGKTLIVVGMGRIGGRLIRLAKAFEMHVIGVRANPAAGAEGADEVFGMDALPAILPRADMVVLVCPLTPETTGLMNATTLAAMTTANVGARYGQYTGASKGDSSNPANPILQETGAGKGGWYWIEVLPYDQSSKTSGVIVGGSGATNLDLLPLNLKPHVVYRITALAQGLKPNSRVVLQQTYARQITKD